MLKFWFIGNKLFFCWYVYSHEAWISNWWGSYVNINTSSINHELWDQADQNSKLPITRASSKMFQKNLFCVTHSARQWKSQKIGQKWIPTLIKRTALLNKIGINNQSMSHYYILDTKVLLSWSLKSSEDLSRQLFIFGTSGRQRPKNYLGSLHLNFTFYKMAIFLKSTVPWQALN